MFSNGRVEKIAEGQAGGAIIRSPRIPASQQLAKRSRSGLDEAGTPIPKQRAVGIRDALFEAIIDRFYTDPTLIAYGEENRDWGGAFAVYRGLTEALPYHRLFNSPIREGAIVGTAVGYALEGGRVLVELMYCDFMGRAGDEIFNQLAKWQAMSGGLLKMPVVLRVSVGSKYGAQHSQDWTSMCAAHSRSEGRVPGDALRRQGADVFGPVGHRPGGLLREPANLRPAGSCFIRVACRVRRTRSPSASPT